jgi:hypothetical protein
MNMSTKPLRPGLASAKCDRLKAPLQTSVSRVVQGSVPVRTLIKKLPVAPPAYRPQALPRVLQTKIPLARQPGNQSKLPPIAPSVYRPQPTPKVMQRKMGLDHRLREGQKPGRPVAPPVYRSQPSPGALQRKNSQTLIHSRSERNPIVQQARQLPPGFIARSGSINKSDLAHRGGARHQPPPVQAYRTGASIGRTSASARGAAGVQVIQRARIAAGYDRISAGKKGDVLITSGLANCIAVAAQDLKTGAAVMGHLNTGTITYNDEAHYAAFRELLLNELERVAGGKPNPRFHVSLGSLWVGTGDQTNAWWNMRHAIILNCISAFKAEPTVAGTTAEFDVSAGIIKGNATLSEGENAIGALPEGWANAGDAIPYADLRGTNSSGWKLTKNRSIFDKLSLAMG